jgi:outer membrane protein assembly factor BamB
VACLVNQHWWNLILYGINGDTGTRLWKVKVNEQRSHKYTVMIFIYEQTV